MLFTKYIYKLFTSGFPLLSHNIFTNNPYHASFLVQPQSTYINYKLDLNNREFMFERVDKPNYNHYRKWKSLREKILNISGL